MNERVAQLVAQVREVWNGLPVGRRLMFGGAAGAVFLILIVLALTLRSDGQREILFSGLTPGDAAQVLQELEARGISYRIEPGASGTTSVYVPPSLVHRTRIDLAAEGIPSQGSVGFEIFDTSQLGMTDDIRRINLRRALNGELERTIRALDVVDDVRVQVALPENRLFISQQQQPTAAVMVTLRPGMRLTAEQVRAIQRLVGATVEGLSPDDVFVVDNRGAPLSDQLSQVRDDVGLTSVEKQLLIQQAVSSEYTRQIRSMLEGPFGVGRVEARVNVEINFEQAEEIIRAFEAPRGNEGIVRSRQTTEESFIGTGAPPGGIPGAESNIPGYPGLVPAGDAEYLRIEETTNFEINETETRRVIPPGAIRRVTASVLIDGELTDEQEAAVANAIATALALVESRGDQVHVDSMPFATSQALAAAQAEVSVWGIPPQYAVAAVALLALLVVLLYLRSRRRKGAPEAGVDIIVDDEEEDLLDRHLTPEERRRQQMREQILAMAKERPEDIAQLVKSWLMEE